ncbi:MAG: gliding motility-associated ABC transporter substrate-binding protein GldG [Bacteroidales bacterium]|nr:gliding motility-associated ABC transporter substrate-binding protein GldG [Bacteroidales bacterium]
MKRKEVKKQNIIQLLLTLVIILLVNYIFSFVLVRVDLTSEKRYSISEPTKDLLKNLNDVVYFKVYLNGDLPSGFKQLEKSTKEMLDEFRAYSKNNIEYEFINPSESSDKKTRNEIYRQLFDKGLHPTNLSYKEDDGTKSQKIIFPGLIISYRGEELAVNILSNNIGASPEQNLNESIQELEYKLSNAIKKISTNSKPEIAFIEGQGELDKNSVLDITNSLKEFYNVKRVRLNNKLSSLRDSLKHNKFSLIIIAKPDSAFNEKDKFIIDQFIMNGGKVLWLVDAVKADIDSLAYSNSTIALANNINIDDQLFKYGVRINPNLIEDIQCAVIPVNTALVGAQPKFTPSPWLFFPLISASQTNPITRNLNLIKTEFVSSIDTVGNNPSVKKTILLHSSNYTKVVNAPARISLDMVDQQPDQRQFNKRNVPIAILLEGQFESVFKNRLAVDIAKSKDIAYKDKSDDTKMIVVADGDIIKNRFKYYGEKIIPYPLGYDRYTRQTFGNKEFILNAIDYLTGNSDLMQVRSREIKLRLLDKTKINNQRLKWQIINTILPIFVIIIIGIILIFLRKRKYTK